jgi:hypothetical protein
MNRNLLGIVAVVLLLLGGITHFFGPGGNSASGFAGGCIRVGLVLGAFWLALPQILATAARMPGWLLGFLFKKQLPPADSGQAKQPAQPEVKPPRPRRRSNAR